MRALAVTILLAALAAAPALAADDGPMVDLTKAVLMTSGAGAAPQDIKVVSMLRDEVRKRTGVSWSQAVSPAPEVPVIVVAVRTRLPALAAAWLEQHKILDLSKVQGHEGFALAVAPKARRAPTVFVLGNDDRGLLFGVGRLLRELRMRRGKITLPADFSVITAPKYRMRGHQLGYRPKANSYDMWDVARYEQYIADLAVFGTNAIELIPSFAMDDREEKNDLMPVDPWEMTVALPEVIARHNLDVWFWLPNKDADITTLSGVRLALKNRERLFKACKRLDGILVPGGDPGNLPPEDLMPFLEKMSRVLESAHPGATLWVSHQGFDEQRLADFYAYLEDKRPRWLEGVAYGPWTHDTLEHTREAVPRRYAVRRYPDITHTVRCQYPVPGWDDALAWTLNREPINPRPLQSAHIHNVLAKHAVGFISYSDGCNDDVNKIIWSAMAWDPGANVREILVQYGRYFIGPDFAEEVADGLLALERNWQAPLLGSGQIAETLAHWQAMEKRAPPKVLANWRFQQGLFRAYYDAYVQQRLARETAAEQDAYVKLRQARSTGADAAIAQARQVLAHTYLTPVAPDLRARIEALADDLYKSIGMQLSVEKHGAQGAERGAVLTTLETPLNNRLWLEAVFDQVQGKDEQTKLAAIDRILTWENPGPGSFYDDFGNPTREPHLLKWPGWERDPGFVLGPKDAHGGRAVTRISWRHQAEALYTAPLHARYEDLDPNGMYEVQVVYAGRYGATMVLTADGMPVHGPVAPARPPSRIAYPIPRAATDDGVLDLTWTHTTGRGAQVAEVWLIKKN